jgi:hypothetical protein
VRDDAARCLFEASTSKIILESSSNESAKGTSTTYLMIRIYRNIYISSHPSINVLKSLQFRVVVKLLSLARTRTTGEHVKHPTCIEFTVRSAAEEAQGKQIKLRLGHSEYTMSFAFVPTIDLLLPFFVYNAVLLCVSNYYRRGDLNTTRKSAVTTASNQPAAHHRSRTSTSTWRGATRPAKY